VAKQWLSVYLLEGRPKLLKNGRRSETSLFLNSRGTGISRKGIEFDSLDGKPVHFLFLVANPPGTWTPDAVR